MSYPDNSKIQQIHKKYAPNQDAFDIIYSHCKIVWEIAQELINKKDLKVNSELVRTGCLLHDIGVYKLFQPDGTFYDPKTYIRHALLGQKIIEAEGLEDTLGVLISRHIGMGITEADIKKNDLPLPARDFVPISFEERLVCYADGFHVKKVVASFFQTSDSQEQRLKRFGEDKIKTFEKMHIEFGEPNLEILAKKYNQAVK